MICLMTNCYGAQAKGSFDDFSTLLFTKIMDLGRDYGRIDIACDDYPDDSIKNWVRALRGFGNRFIFTGSTALPKDFNTNFLRNDKNKECFNNFLMEKITHFSFEGKIVVFSNGNSIIQCNSSGVWCNCTILYCHMVV